MIPGNMYTSYVAYIIVSNHYVVYVWDNCKMSGDGCAICLPSRPDKLYQDLYPCTLSVHVLLASGPRGSQTAFRTDWDSIVFHC